MRYIIIVLAVPLLALSIAQCAGATERTPAGSYLVHRATTVGELRDQIAKNALVRSRYVRHFGASPAELDSYVSGLALTSLKEPLRTKCWYIDKAGRQFVKTKLLPRGSMVFATSDGQPVLLWSCGNPVRADLPKTLVKSWTQTTHAAATQAEDKPETKVLANPMEIASTAVVAAPPAPALAAALPVASPPVLATVAAPAVSAPPILAGSLGVLGLLGGVALAPKSGGTPPTVPEPSSLVALASMLCLLPGACRISRRRR